MLLTLGRTCPMCGTDEVRKSKFRDWDYLLLPLLMRPVRCSQCLHRHYRPWFYPALERPRRKRRRHRAQGEDAASAPPPDFGSL